MKNLSKVATTICFDNYTNNCGGCPLRPECVDSTRGKYNWELDAWVTRVNDLAEAVSK